MTRCTMMERLAVMGLASLLLTAAAFAADPSEAGYYYTYFDQLMPVDLDTDRVAVVQDRTIQKRSATDVTASLALHGFAAEDVTATARPNLLYAAVPAGSRAEGAIETLVADLASDPQLDFVSPVFLDSHGDPLLMTSHLHVAFGDDVSAGQAEAILTRHVPGVVVRSEVCGIPGVYRVKCELKDGFEMLALANAVAALPETRYAEVDKLMTARKHLTPNDPWFGSPYYYLWGLHNIGQSGGTSDMDMDGPEAWDLTTGDATTIVVVLDDGVEQDHPDINQVAGQDFTGSGTGGGPGNYCDNHGTAVAGCVSGIINNSLGGLGIAPDCMSAGARFSVSNTPCDGAGTFYVNDLVDAIEWAETIGAEVTNNSSGFDEDSLITDAYNTTYDNGVVHFASSGNSGQNDVNSQYPAYLAKVNAVGAINRNGNRASFSSYGSGLAFVAPGQSIMTTDRTGSDGYGSSDYDWVDGTSFSSPYAAGVAALIRSYNPSLTPAQVTNLMEQTAKDRGAGGYDIFYGWGIVQAYDALLNAVDAEPPSPAPTFETPPEPYLTPSFLRMVATEATDFSDPVQYQFVMVSGGAGGQDSFWQTSRTYIIGGLAPNTSYTYLVWARDSADPINYTVQSDPATGWTMVQDPGTPVLNGETASTIDVNVDPNGNPAHTDFAIQCTSTTDPAWNGKWVNASGSPVSSAVWQTDGEWGTITVQGLQPETQYCFGVQAINGDGSDLSSLIQSCATTTSSSVSALIESASSCRLHGGSEVCLDLDVVNVEPRTGGPDLIRFGMDSSVASVDATVDCVNAGAYSGTVTVTTAGPQVDVALDPALPDVDCCTITLSGDSEDTFAIRILAGDVDRTGGVLGSDMLSVKPYIGQAASPSNAFADVDVNGTVLGSDMLAVKPQIGGVAPSCP